MFISVILCTYNRSRILAEALNSVAVSILPTSVDWEVLVVDNNSTDRTGEVVQDFCRRYPDRFRYVMEPQQGISYARNRGIKESRGEIVAFMDDDVTVDPDWLWNLTKSLQNGEWAGAGGRIFPTWECSPPSWLNLEQPHALGPFVAFDRGSQAAPLLESPFGANMAFRREVFERHGGFRTDLGRTAHNLLGNEDSEFGRRLLAAGERLRYEPSAVMHHPVTEERLQKTYLLSWWFSKGRADIRETGIPAETKWFFARIPFYPFCRLTRWALRWMIAVDSKKRFSCKLNVWNIAGQITGCYEVSLYPKERRRGLIRQRR